MSVAGEENCLAGKQNSFTSSAVIHPLRTAFRRHWRLYVDEGVELAIFMISACFFTVWLFNPALPALHLLPSSALRRLLMGISMGGTAILIIRSPMGKRSGAHFNPVITLTYLRLGKIDKWDAGFYVISQFIGGICGVGLSALCLRSSGRSLGGLCRHGSWMGGTSRCVLRGVFYGGPPHAGRALVLESTPARSIHELSGRGF